MTGFLVEHLPVLVILLPLLSAPIVVLTRRGSLAWPLAVAISWLTLAAVGALCAQVFGGQVISYQLGGWAPPWGIEYRVDTLNAFVMLIVAGVGAAVFPFARGSIDNDCPAERHHLFYGAMLLCMAGLLGIAITGDAFNVFVFLEISSLSSYALIAMGRSRRALSAAYQYLIMGTIGGTFILIGVGLLYMVTGTLNMGDLAVRIAELHAADRGIRTLVVALAFFGVGASLKLALFPLHLWLPNAYTFAPTPVTAFLAATATKVSFYVLVRMAFTVLGYDFTFARLHLDAMLMPLALLGIFVASTVAVMQHDIKRLLAWSSVAQIGYMVLGVSFLNVDGLTGGLVHLFNHALMKGAAFMAVGCVIVRLGSGGNGSLTLEQIRGLGRRMPWTFAAFVIGGLGLIGVPVTGGFVSKWFLVSAALGSGLWPVAVAMLLSSLLALVYVWRVIESAFFREPAEGAPNAEAPLGVLVPTWIVAIASLVFGVYTELPVGMAREAAEMLMKVAG